MQDQTRAEPSWSESERCCGEASICGGGTRGLSGKMPVSQLGLGGERPERFSASVCGRIEGASRLPRAAPLTAVPPYLLIEPLAPGAKSHLACVIKSRVARKSRALLIRERHSCIVVVFRSWHHCHSKLPVRLNIELVVLRASIIPPTFSSPPHHLLSCTSNLIFCQVVAFK